MSGKEAQKAAFYLLGAPNTVKNKTHIVAIHYLKFKLGAAKVSPLFLPKVIRLDYQCNVNATWKGFL